MPGFLQAFLVLFGLVAFIWISQFAIRKVLTTNRKRMLLKAGSDLRFTTMHDLAWIKTSTKQLQNFRFDKIAHAFEADQPGRRCCVFDYFVRHDHGGESTRSWDSACVVEHTSPLAFKVLRDTPILSNLIPSRLLRVKLTANYSIYAEEETVVSFALQDALRTCLVGDDVSEIQIQPNVLLVRPRKTFLSRRFPRSAGEWCMLAARFIGLSRDYAEPDLFWDLLKTGLNLAKKIEQLDTAAEFDRKGTTRQPNEIA